MRIAPRSRLPKSVVQLRRAVATGSYGDSPSDRDRTARAYFFIADLAHIANTPLLHQQVVSGEIQVALDGGLECESSERAPFEMQSQCWVGVALFMANPLVGVPAGQGRRPDFALPGPRGLYGVEVTRPHTWKSAVRALDRAAGQIRDWGRNGVVVLDLSDCLIAGGCHPADLSSEEHIRDVVRPALHEHSRPLLARGPAYQRSDKYGRVMGVVLFCRVAWWRRDGQQYSVVQSQFCSGFPRPEPECVRATDELLLGLNRSFGPGDPLVL